MQNSVFPALSSSTKRFLLSTSALSIALIGSPAMAQTVSSPANEQTSPPKSGLPATDPATAPQTTELDETTTEDIVVRGIRAALESAKDIKRNADTVVDSITASDIATLPDLSVAEALGRVPGVTMH